MNDYIKRFLIVAPILTIVALLLIYWKWGDIITVKELSQLYYLSKEIKVEKEKLEKLETVATKITQSMSGMPFNGGISDKTATAAEIADCKSIIESMEQQAVAEYNRIIRYIASVDDTFIRQIIKYKFIELMSWNKVADKIGGYNTEDSVRKALTRYLNKN